MRNVSLQVKIQKMQRSKLVMTLPPATKSQSVATELTRSLEDIG